MVKRQRFLVLVVNRFAKTISFGKFNVGRTTDAIILVGSEFSSGVTAATHELRRKARLEGETTFNTFLPPVRASTIEFTRPNTSSKTGVQSRTPTTFGRKTSAALTNRTQNGRRHDELL